MQDVFDVTLSGLSKVTNFLRGSIVNKPSTRHSNAIAERQQQAVQQTTNPPDHLTHR